MYIHNDISISIGAVIKNLLPQVVKLNFNFFYVATIVSNSKHFVYLFQFNCYDQLFFGLIEM